MAVHLSLHTSFESKSVEITGIIFQTIALLMALLAITILIWVNQEKSHRKNVLVILLLVLALLNLNGVIYHNRWYLLIPWFHKVLIPFSLLITPAAYLYIRAVVQGEMKFRRYDWLLTLPAIMFALNLLPYYTLSIAEKKSYLIEYYRYSALRTRESEGILPPYVFSFVRVAWSVLFITLNYRLITRFRKQASPTLLQNNHSLLNWLSQLNALLVLLLAAAMFAAAIAPLKKTIYNILDLSLGIIVVVICMKLFFRPKILYGVFEPLRIDPKLQDENQANGKSIPVSPTEALTADTMTAEEENPGMQLSKADVFRCKAIIESFFNDHMPYINPAYTLDMLVRDTKIPRYMLSAFINKEYGIGFREYLNSHRIAHFKANLNNPAWDNMTLEAIALECGFSSRSTFIKNFKQISGQTPSEYLKNSKISKDESMANPQ